MSGKASARSNGFTLVELMIVVGILAVLMGIALPTIRNAKKSAATAQAIGLLKTTFSISEQYKLRFGVYASSETDLVNAGLMPVENSLTSRTYDYVYTSSETTWSMNANPKVPGETADNYFFIDQSGVIRFDRVGEADETSQPVD
jgi:prepilin-type N-terminal cleavage/methylation domain-containing protein